jgi:hypothetical protein
VGTLTTGAETWNGGASYLCELNATNASGSDRLGLTGALNIQSAPTSPFIIKLVSLTPGNAAGLLAGFNKFTNYTWTIATASGGISNFAANKFAVDTSAFANEVSGGSFAVDVSGSSLLLKYQAAPLVLPQFTGIAVGTGAFSLSGTGGVGQAYVLLGSTNLRPALWTAVATNLADANGVFQFSDPRGANTTQQFYRITVP